MATAPIRKDTAAPARKSFSPVPGILQLFGMDSGRNAARSCGAAAVLFLALAFAHNAPAAEAGLSYYDLAVFAYEDGQYHRAVQYFNKALQSRPQDPFLRLYLGQSHLQLDRLGQAERHLTAARRIDPELPGLDYSLGRVYFRQGKYPAASKAFARAAEGGPKRVLAGYFAGVSLFKQSRCREGLGYLMRASRAGSGPLEMNALYFAALCHRKLGRDQRARALLERIAGEAGSERLRESAEEALERTQAQDRRFQFYAEAGYEYDSNVPLEPSDVDLVSDEADFLLTGYLSARYDVLRSGPFLMGAGYSHYQTWHEELGQFDVIASVPSVYSSLKMDPLTFGMDYSPSYYWVDSESFLRSHELTPSLEWRATERLAARLSYTYADQEFFEERGRSGHAHEIGLDLTRTFLQGRLALLAGGSYRDKIAARQDEGYKRLEGELGLSVQLPLGFSLLTIGGYEYAEYDEEDEGFAKVREDKLYRTSAALSHPFFFDGVGIVFEYEYARNDSSISFYEYDRHTASVSWTYEY